MEYDFPMPERGRARVAHEALDQPT